MPSLQSLRRKIASVKNTQKITKAMKMVASAKLKRAQARILAFRPYGLKMREVVANLSRRVNRELHPLLQKRPTKMVRVVVVTSDRGLCGGFNANIVRKALEFIRDDECVEVTPKSIRLRKRVLGLDAYHAYDTTIPLVDFDRLEVRVLGQQLHTVAAPAQALQRGLGLRPVARDDRRNLGMLVADHGGGRRRISGGPMISHSA